MFSVCSHLRGGYPSQVQLGGVPKPGPARGGTQARSSHGGTLTGGYPTLGTPDLARGVPQQGGTPIKPGQGGSLAGGVPHLRYPSSPHQTWQGGTPMGGVPHRVVLDMPRSVCLLHSRRRTFLFLK